MKNPQQPCPERKSLKPGIEITNFPSYSAAAKHLVARTGIINFIYFSSYALLRESELYRRAIASSDILLADGIGLQILAALKYRVKLHNNNGTDLLPELLESMVQSGRDLFVFGGSKEVNDQFVKLARSKGIQCEGLHGFTDWEATRCKDHSVLLVALGTPKQEAWLCANRPDITRKHILAIGVGGFLDFYTGNRKRAPRFVRKLRLEFLYRVFFYPRENLKKFLRCFLIFRELFSADN